MNLHLIRLHLAGFTVTGRWQRALRARGHHTTADRIGRVGARLFARPYLCTCRACRANGTTHPAVLHTAGYTDLHKRPSGTGAR